MRRESRVRTWRQERADVTDVIHRWSYGRGLDERAAGFGSDRIGTAEPLRRAFRQEGDWRIGNGDGKPRVGMADRASAMTGRASPNAR
jgi:hypothetical protein